MSDPVINRTELPVGVSNVGVALPSDQPLWRYTRLSTLLSLTWNRIFVPSLATLRRDDPKEALRLGKQTDEFWLNAPREEYDRLYSKADDYERKWLSENENYPAIAGQVLYRIWQREILNERCAWCWHGAEIESMAMWHQYSSRIGIAFKTTVTRLTSALIDAKYCALIGKVNYSKEVSEDYFCRPYFLKEPCYRHEEEVRVIFPYKPSLVGEPGMHLRLEWRQFLEEIVVSPFIPEPEAAMLKEFLLQSFPGVKVSVSPIMTTGSGLSEICFHENFGDLPDITSLNDILSCWDRTA